MHEAQIEQTPEGHVPAGDGWFIRNLSELAWATVPGFGAWYDFFPGCHVHVLAPGEANGVYHSEDAQEGFLVLSGECIALVEGDERRMRQWDYLHSPPGTAHITIGAGDEPCAILMFGAPDPHRTVEWIADEVAARYGASPPHTTNRDTEAYGDIPPEVRIPAPKPFAASS
jgi:uncharacterized cupin superfamily protein